MDLPEDRKTFLTSRIALHAREVMRRRGGNSWYSHRFSSAGDLYERGMLNTSNCKEFFRVSF